MITSVANSIAFVCFAFLYHPVHETLWEVQWNRTAGTVEVALRLNALDEQWIQKTHNAKQRKDWRADFLAGQIYFDPIKREVTDAKSDRGDYVGLPIKWVGRKEEGAHVWWFFEVNAKDGKPPSQVRTRLLFDHERDYQHWLIVLGDRDSPTKRRPAVVLTRQRPQLKLDLARKG